MKESDILSLGFEKSRAHLAPGMDKYGEKHYKLNIPNSNRYLYIETRDNKTSIQTIGVASNNVKNVFTISAIIDYIFDASIKAGEDNFKLKLNSLLK